MSVPDPRTVAAAVDAYLAENGFTRAAYTAARVPVEVGRFTVMLPNGPARQRAIPQHDVHHALTGYGTDLIGEAEIGAWELRAGCTNLFLYWINLTATVVGFFLSPRRVLRAFHAARGARTLYALDLRADEVADVPLEEMRRRCGVPPGGVADIATRRLHRTAPIPTPPKRGGEPIAPGSGA
jgi:hypothetical protein